MKIIAWNVNGIRAMIKRDNLDNLINHESPDIFCLGETKISCPYDDVEEAFVKKLNSKYFAHWSACKTRGGYSGTAIFTKVKPINVVNGLLVNGNEYDNEGRVITCEFKKFYLVHVYTPNSGEALARLDYRTKEWDPAFKKYILKLQSTKKVIVCGDLNVAHTEIDLKNPKTNLRTAGYTLEERESFTKFLNDTQFIDTYRYQNPEGLKYSYWSYRFKSRERNTGWRIDYFLIDKKLKKKLIKSDILTEIYGSDHCPIILDIEIK
uniref:Endonuclease/exonuclease/phosphatase domain-containing protein n=1 Tax=viral metagenome TaxID=1070528 RepID=A0A6C0DAP8_9ZZZZ